MYSLSSPFDVSITRLAIDILSLLNLAYNVSYYPEAPTSSTHCFVNLSCPRT